jgi:guanylate kinase
VNRYKILSSKGSTRGKIIILVAPSGAGKSTMARRLLNDFETLRFSVSATTRKPRSGEKDGVDYYFISDEAFSEKIEQDGFLEWEEFYNGQKYGTLRKAVEEQLNRGYSILLDIEVLGAANIKKIYGDEALAIFIKPPSLDVLKQRLMKRGTESEQMLKTRLERAEKELTYEDRFDAVVVNDDLETAYQKIKQAVAAFIEA